MADVDRQARDELYGVRINRRPDPTPADFARSLNKDVGTDEFDERVNSTAEVANQLDLLRKESRRIIRENIGDKEGIEEEFRKLLSDDNFSDAVAILGNNAELDKFFVKGLLDRNEFHNGGDANLLALKAFAQTGSHDGKQAAVRLLGQSLSGMNDDFPQFFRKLIDRRSEKHLRDPILVLDTFEAMHILFEEGGLETGNIQGAMPPRLSDIFDRNPALREFKIEDLQRNWNYMRDRGLLGDVWGKLRGSMNQRRQRAQEIQTITGKDGFENMSKVEQLEFIRPYFGEDFSLVGATVPFAQGRLRRLNEIRNLKGADQASAIQAFMKDGNSRVIAQTTLGKREFANWRQTQRTGFPIKAPSPVSADKATRALADRFLKILKKNDFSVPSVRALNEANPQAMRFLAFEKPAILEKIQIAQFYPGLRRMANHVQIMARKLPPDEFRVKLAQSVEENPDEISLMVTKFPKLRALYEGVGVDIPLSSIVKKFLNIPTLDEELQDVADILEIQPENPPAEDFTAFNGDNPTIPAFDEGKNDVLAASAASTGNEAQIRGTRDTSFSKFVRQQYDSLRTGLIEKKTPGVSWPGKDGGRLAPPTVQATGVRGETFQPSANLTMQQMLTGLGQEFGPEFSKSLLQNRERIITAVDLGLDPDSNFIQSMTQKGLQTVAAFEKGRKLLKGAKTAKKIDDALGKANAVINLAGNVAQLTGSEALGQAVQVASGTVQGAQAGAALGPIGAAVGGALGLAAGLKGVIGGNKAKREAELKRSTQRSQIIQQRAQERVAAGFRRAATRVPALANAGLAALDRQRAESAAAQQQAFRRNPSIRSKFNTLQDLRGPRPNF